MCMYVNEQITAEFKARPQNTEIVAWKVLLRCPSEPIALFSLCYDKQREWKPGVHQSDRELIEFEPATECHHTVSGFLRSVDKGIHVCLTKQAAAAWCGGMGSYVIVEVRCKLSDLVAVGGDLKCFPRIPGDPLLVSKSEAVFMAVTLDEAEYKRVEAEYERIIAEAPKQETEI